MRSRPRPAGKTLIELLVVMAAASVILTTAGRLLFQLSRTERSVREGTSVGRAEIRFARDFRADVRRAATAVLIGSGKGLRLTTSEGKTEYTAEDVAIVRTEAGATSRREAYRLGPIDVSIGLDGNLVTLTVRPKQAEHNAMRSAAGPLRLIAVVGADRLGNERIASDGPQQPVEALRPKFAPAESTRPEQEETR